MDTPITASFRWTQEEFLSLQRILMRHSPLGRYMRRSTLTVGLFAVAMGVIVWATQGVHSVAIAFLPVGLGLLASPWFIKRANIKHYAQRPDRGMVVNWEFRPDGIHSKTEASSGEISWRMILKVLKTPQGFLFYINDRVFHWIPAHAFPNDEAIENLSTLIKSRVQRYDEAA